MDSSAERSSANHHGGDRFQPPSSDRATGLFFVIAHETCTTRERSKPTPPIKKGGFVRRPGGPGRRTESRMETPLVLLDCPAEEGYPQVE
jgi:hypothetical protein